MAEVTHSVAPPHLVSLLTPVTAISARQRLRSADLAIWPHRRPRTVEGFGPRSFSAAGPSAWNSLLSELKNMSSSDCRTVHKQPAKDVGDVSRSYYALGRSRK